MNSRDIEIYQVETVFGTSSDFYANINIPFHVDEMVIKSVSYSDVGTTNSSRMAYVKSNLTSGKILATIPSAYSFMEQFNIPFKLNTSVNSSYNFTLTNNDNSLWTSDGAFEIAITILFIKWKKV
eukprot:Lithocolla_globosa_v1_NODE_146_length_5712_cov_12.381121.p5 type:complete len:125 gc:universal NODE_146_length_5712_cov_12.381121:3967-4341(+)